MEERGGKKINLTLKLVTADKSSSEFVSITKHSSRNRYGIRISAKLSRRIAKELGFEPQYVEFYTVNDNDGEECLGFAFKFLKEKIPHAVKISKREKAGWYVVVNEYLLQNLNGMDKVGSRLANVQLNKDMLIVFFK
ncbi:hypothetical protein PAP_06175 [Palaeococcus pacificus DY20341]|uniref:Uncharacterized protein n=1 Tax=Palaeococcus pacificus DY20341 TaxID=1343739 RepID=A0A075LSC1_9EURY|nr:hypothetical protein [Palaeococcus pacificus]AIF69635.1 hypothetical protein PAP_06175 [Palaeococcus pacificus DY20341]